MAQHMRGRRGARARWRLALAILMTLVMVPLSAQEVGEATTEALEAAVAEALAPAAAAEEQAEIFCLDNWVHYRHLPLAL